MIDAGPERDAAAFFDKWMEAWPATRAAQLFASDGEWPGLRARVGTLFEIGEACWVLNEPTVREHKLAWWHEELQRLAQRQVRHPLLIAAPGLVLPQDMAMQALRLMHAVTPAGAAASVGAVTAVAGTASPDAPVNRMDRLLLAAMYLVALRDGCASAFALAPLDLRARHAVASAERGAALDALVAALASAWLPVLQSAYQSPRRSDWRGNRGARVFAVLAWRLVRALAQGREPPAQDWRGSFVAWRSVVGLD